MVTLETEKSSAIRRLETPFPLILRMEPTEVSFSFALGFLVETRECSRIVIGHLDLLIDQVLQGRKVAWTTMRLFAF